MTNMVAASTLYGGIPKKSADLKTQLKYEESAAESVFVLNLFIKDLY